MFKKIEEILEKYDNLKKELNSLINTSNYNKISEIDKELKLLEPILELYHKRCKVQEEIDENILLLNSEKDSEVKEYIVSVNEGLSKELSKIDEDIKKQLIPQDKNDGRNIILEIHAGTGGDEAGIFVGDLFRMYSKYIEINGWKLNVISFVESSSGGYKEIICGVEGKEAYSVLKYESGVHRVQRIPKTESKGRVHTSAVSVVVMPEADDIDVNINMSDIRKDTFCSTGAGGQSVNTTYSAVRLTHIPTSLVVTCQDERSQIKNFDKAMKVLKARLYKISLEKQQREIGELKRTMVKHGDRSDKIRTYNYPQNRVTDHRINFTSHNLDRILDGDLKELTTALKIALSNLKEI